MSSSISILADDLAATGTAVLRHPLHGAVWCTTRRGRACIGSDHGVVPLPYENTRPVSLVAFRARVLVGLQSWSSSTPEVALLVEPKTGALEQLSRLDSSGELQYAAWQGDVLVLQHAQRLYRKDTDLGPAKRLVQAGERAFFAAWDAASSGMRAWGLTEEGERVLLDAPPVDHGALYTAEGDLFWLSRGQLVRYRHGVGADTISAEPGEVAGVFYAGDRVAWATPLTDGEGQLCIDGSTPVPVPRGLQLRFPTEDGWVGLRARDAPGPQSSVPRLLGASLGGADLVHWRASP